MLGHCPFLQKPIVYRIIGWHYYDYGRQQNKTRLTFDLAYVILLLVQCDCAALNIG